LERPIIIVLALGSRNYDEAKSGLYVAFSRANYALFVIANPRLAQALAEAQVHNLDSERHESRR
jgi:hypothetical protein